LPLTEKNETDYKSEKPGIMHACGHDVHVASLLGTAFILNDLRNEFSGKLKFIFQPAEERAPGGARQMLDEGALMPDEPDIVIAQHVYPLLESGSIGLKGGIYMASSDEIYITVTGRGGHAAMPHELVDPVTVATQIIVSLQQIVSRFSPPMVPTVLSFGRFIADGSTNVIPDTVYIEGTFRTMNEDWRAEAKKRLSGIAVSVAESLGASCKILIKDGFPLLINDESTAATVRNIACEFLGNDKVHDLEIRMTSEDFSYFAQKYPAVFYRLGTANTEKGINSPLHSSSFDIDESSLETGMGLMAYICLRMLGQ
jgi:amidohydrolase